MAAATRGITTVKGYVVVLPNLNDDDSDLEGSDDDNDWPDFGEMSAMASGGNYIPFSRPKRSRVTIKSLDPPMSNYICEGQLHLTQPWWLITAKTKLRSRVHYIIGYPSYQLRTDHLVTTHKLPTQFLTSVGCNSENVLDPSIEALLKYLEDNGLERELTFENLDEMINRFVASQDEEARTAYKKSISSILWLSAEGQAIRFALMYPQLFKMASQLLPCHFLQMVAKSSYMQKESLHKLEEATSTSPWVFGFKQILYREYGVMGMEANLRSWINSDLIQILPPVQKDALYIYNALKVYAKKKGHTYVRVRDLRKASELMEKHVVRNWNDALDFLDTNAVIVRETETDHVKVFLKSNWYAERDSAKAFAGILENGVKDPLEWDVDLKSSDFDQIATDEDQWTAVHLMCSSPITVLSGKGGCGKTSVVTTLLSHACSRSGELETKENKDFDETFGEGDGTPDTKAENNHSELNMSVNPITQSENIAMTKDGNQNANEAFLSKTNLGSKILLTAPTGKAAVLLGRKASLKSCSLHSVIMSFKMYCVAKNRRNRERGDREDSEEEPSWTHADKEILVVDECSLVSVSTFSTVTNILLKECNLKKIILLGDVRQLPSIEPGNFLGDIFNVFAPLGFSIELRTNHRAESELIVQNATRISYQNNPLFDAKRRFHLLQPQEQDQQGRDEVVRSLLRNAADIQDHTKSQFVAFTRRDCEAVNELCCKHYCGHSLKGPRGKWDFGEGDKVCMTKNGLVSHHMVRKYKSKKDREKEESEKRLASPSVNDKDGLQVQHTSVKKNLFTELRAASASNKQLSVCYSNGDGDSLYGKESKDREFVQQHFDGEAVQHVDRTFDTTSACSHLYEDSLDVLINAAYKQGESMVDLSCFDTENTTQTNTQLNRTDLSSVLDDFFEPSSQSFRKSEKNRLRLTKVKNDKMNKSGGDDARPSTSRCVGVEMKRPLVAKPDPEDPEEIDGSTEETRIVRTDVKLCNGEIFFIERMFTRVSNMGKAQTFLVLSDRDEETPRSVCVEYRQLMKHCKMRHAWVRTIHTFQGSESQSVVYILGNIFYENWQHVYTAITRGRQSVYVVANPVSLNKTIVRRIVPRMTTLNVKLLDHLKPREKMIQTCVQAIAESLKKHKDLRNKGGNSPEDEKSFFDSDDSWLCSVNDTFGLELDGSVIDPGGDNSKVTPIKNKLMSPEDSPTVSCKRRGSHSDDDVLQSPPKTQRLTVRNIAVTPLRSSLNSLSLNYEFSDDELM